MTDNFIRIFIRPFIAVVSYLSHILQDLQKIVICSFEWFNSRMYYYFYETFNGKGNSNAANFLSRFLHIGCYVPNLGHNFLQGKLSDSQWFHFFIRQFASHLLFICEFLSRNLLLPVVYIAKVFHRHSHIYMDVRKDTFTHIDTNTAYNDKYKTQATIP